jgi:hypothetical protein
MKYHKHVTTNYILDASQSAQCVLPGTCERIAWIEPVSTELLSLDLALLLSFPCKSQQPSHSVCQFLMTKYKKFFEIR